ncbi:MAG: hypothetical protein GC147_05890 [Porphyrobacter sp.]|nr:hypothetical protein [Porphyrobacter sp.]
MRGFRLFILAMVTAVATMLLLVSYFTWGMADFDCFDGYLECRHNWWSNGGLMALGAILGWLAAFAWFSKTRKK